MVKIEVILYVCKETLKYFEESIESIINQEIKPNNLIGESK